MVHPKFVLGFTIIFVGICCAAEVSDFGDDFDRSNNNGLKWIKRQIRKLKKEVGKKFLLGIQLRKMSVKIRSL